MIVCKILLQKFILHQKIRSYCESFEYFYKYDENMNKSKREFK